jgi:hypothetical protein
MKINILILRALKSILRNQEVVINLRAKRSRRIKKRRNKKRREAVVAVVAAAQIPKAEEIKEKIKINEAAFKRVVTSIENYKITCGVSKIVTLA